MTSTHHLDLPLIMPSQAQKHVTHNEALAILDALVHCAVADRTRTRPPADMPEEGQRHLVAAGGEDAWSGKDGQLAVWQDGAWRFHLPGAGMLVFVRSESLLLVHDGDGFRAPLARTDRIGVNADAAADRRLTVASDLSLFTHETGDHRLIVNKAQPADTASLVFQSGFSGRAEIGLAGEDAFSLKVSADGAAWRTAMVVAPETGNVGIGAAPTDRLRVKDGNVRIGWNLISAAEQAGAAAMEVGYYGTGDRPAFFDFHASDAWPDFSARFIRWDGEDGPFAILNQGTGGLAFGSYAPAPIRFLTQDQPRMTIDAGGSVGIGTDAPSATLDVRGTVRIGSFTVAQLPAATQAGAGTLAFAVDAAGGPAPVYSDATNWRRLSDSVIVA